MTLALLLMSYFQQTLDCGNERVGGRKFLVGVI